MACVTKLVYNWRELEDFNGSGSSPTFFLYDILICCRFLYMPLIFMQATLIDPCINGTLNVLGSCSKASSVKRVVLTSSCSAIRYRDDVQQVSPLNESHWSDPEYCKRHNVINYTSCYISNCIM